MGGNPIVFSDPQGLDAGSAEFPNLPQNSDFGNPHEHNSGGTYNADGICSPTTSESQTPTEEVVIKPTPFVVPTNNATIDIPRDDAYRAFAKAWDRFNKDKANSSFSTMFLQELSRFAYENANSLQITVSNITTRLYLSRAATNIKGEIVNNNEIRDASYGILADLLTMGAGKAAKAAEKALDIVENLADVAEVLNSRGEAYPKVIVEGYGEIPFPSGQITKMRSPPDLRAKFANIRDSGKFRIWWEAQGREWPTPTQGSRIDIHHIQPLGHGGTNDFENLVPIDYVTQHKLFNRWWSGY